MKICRLCFSSFPAKGIYECVSAAKIVSISELPDIGKAYRNSRQRLVMTNGCFDLLHVGHIRYLQEARAKGDALLVAVNSDESVRQLKGPTRPVTTAIERAEILSALQYVDHVVIFPEMRADKIIRALQPSVYVKGGDYTLETLDPDERHALEKVQAEIALVSLIPGRSTTEILTKSKQNAPDSSPEAATSISSRPMPVPVAILGSGKGSNARAILEAIESKGLPLDVRRIISDNPDAGILQLAHEHQIVAEIIPSGKFRSRLPEKVEKDLARRLLQENIQWVLLAGYMRMVKAPLLQAFPDRMINIHPSLLPAFPGLEAWKQAVEAGATVSGCTVHLVDSGMDTGSILGQAEVPVLPDDSPESLHARIQIAEHELYPKILHQLVTGEIAFP